MGLSTAFRNATGVSSEKLTTSEVLSICDTVLRTDNARKTDLELCGWALPYAIE
jgi:hypothetical protein